MIRKENVLKRYIPDEAQTKKLQKRQKLNNRNSVNLAGAKASVS